MNIRDYIRTNEGIAKIREYRYQPEYENCHVLWFENKNCGVRYTDKELGKSSPNIIDLIEVGDLMFIDISPDDYGGIVVPRIAETENELQKYLNKINSGECILKGILTKEQIENGVYKL